MKRRIVINGRFLGRKVTGVERYGHGILSCINELVQMKSPLVDGLEFVVAVPPGVQAQQYLAIEQKVLPFFKGYIWEQVTLPLWARGREIWNFCNLAPMISPGIVCIHDAHIHVVPENYRFAYRTAQRIIQPIIASRAKWIVTVSEHSKRRLQHFGVAPPERVVVIQNSAEHAFAFEPLKSHLDVTALPERFVLLLASNSPNKNIDCILRISDDLYKHGIRVVTTGGGSTKVLSSDSNDTAGNVLRLGYVSDDDLAALYSRALCLVFPSIEEGFGLPPLEAFIWGTAVVASNTSSIPEVCGDAALYADPFKPQEWLEQILALNNNTELRNDLLMRGKKRVEQFSFEGSTMQWLHLIHGKPLQ